MKVHIHRGQNQIGGSIIEVATRHTSIILDAGLDLDEENSVAVPKINGLFSGTKQYHAVFVSHYHPDHVGLVNALTDGIPVWMGKEGYAILRSSNDYRRSPTNFSPSFLYDRQTITVGDLNITPFRCDHSAYDSYMLLVEGEGKRILYTGDFRANGRRDYEALLHALPEVDAVIIEGTTLSRKERIRNLEEQKLEDIAVQYLTKHSGPCFMLLSAMNIDRLVTAAHIAERTNRILLEDVYTAGIAQASQIADIQPDQANIRVFQTDGSDRQHNLLRRYKEAGIGKAEIAKRPFIMCIRQSMQRYLEKRSQELSFSDGVLFYAMWKGYQKQPGMADFLDFMQKQGVKLHTLHTSGHADEETIDALLGHISPRTIIPVHTENAAWFNKYRGICNVVTDEPVIEIQETAKTHAGSVCISDPTLDKPVINLV